MTTRTFLKIALIMTSLSLITACHHQSVSQTPTPVVTDTIAFNITGKIGITTATKDGKTASSAFYSWSQQNNRFAIDLTGALGIGATSIRYDGTTATLTNEKTGEISADSPEALLQQATGWQAPISDLPYWILGKNAPNDSNSQFDTLGKLSQTTQGNWTAYFDYDNQPLPTRLRITHSDGHRVVLSIGSRQ